MKKAIIFTLLLLTVIGLTFGFSQTNFRTTALDSAAQQVNIGYTTLNNINIAYPGTSIVYVKFYDSATKPYAKAKTPVLTMQLGTSATLSYSLKSFNNVIFRNGCWIRCVTHIADTAQTGVQPAVKPLVEITY